MNRDRPLPKQQVHPLHRLFRTDEMGDLPRLELLSGLQSLYRTRDYSDLTLVGADGSRHGVHKAIVCPRSQYFRQAVQERRWKDGRENQLAILEEDPEILNCVVDYLYLLDYQPPVLTPLEESEHNDDESTDVSSIRTNPADYGHVYGTSAVMAFGGPDHPSYRRHRIDSSRSTLSVHAVPSAGFETFRRPAHLSGLSESSVTTAQLKPSPLATRAPNLLLHANMFSAGVRYGIDGLKALALDKYKIQLTRHWNTPEFVESIHVVYNTTPSSHREMREAVGETLTWHAHLLEKPEIEAVVCEINGLAYELLKRSRLTQLELNEE